MKLTLRERVLMFFARNPDEELSTHDIMEKFGILHSKSVKKGLMYAVDQALLERRWTLGSVAVYSAGPALLAEVGK